MTSSSPIDKFAVPSTAHATQRKLAKSMTGATPGTPVKQNRSIRLTRGVVVANPGDGTVTVVLDGDDATNKDNWVAGDALGHSYYPIQQVVEILQASGRTVVLGTLSTAYGSDWTNLTLTGHWLPYVAVGGYAPPAFKILNNEVVCRGLVANANSVGSAEGLFVPPLPPINDVILNCWGDVGGTEGPVRLQVGGGSSILFTHNVYIVNHGIGSGASAAVPFFSLDQLRWYID